MKDLTGNRYFVLVLASMLLAACGGAADETTATLDSVSVDEADTGADDDTIAATATATDAPTPTETPVTYRGLLVDLGEHPCQLVTTHEVGLAIIPGPEEDGVEASMTDGDGSITGTCTYEGFVMLSVFIPGPGVDLQASYDQAVPEDNVAIENREPARLWGLEDDTLYVLKDDLWYGLTIQAEPEKDRLFAAVDLSEAINGLLPEDPSIPTPTRVPTRAPVAFLEACALLTIDEVEAQFGVLSESPIFSGDPSPVSGASQSCIYYAGLDAMTVTAFRYAETVEAQESFDQMTAVDEAESVDGFGDAAFWIPDDQTHGFLRILQGSDILELIVDLQSGSARRVAETLAPIALERLINPLPTPTPGPTLIPLDACDLMSADEAETVLGELSGPPQSGASVGEGDELGPLYTQDCIYNGELGTAYVSVLQGMGEDHARQIYERFQSDNSTNAQEIKGLGDAAFTYAYDAYSRTTVVLEGRFVISALVTGDYVDTMSIDIWDFLLRNLP